MAHPERRCADFGSVLVGSDADDRDIATELALLDAEQGGTNFPFKLSVLLKLYTHDARIFDRESPLFSQLGKIKAVLIDVSRADVSRASINVDTFMDALTSATPHVHTVYTTKHGGLIWSDKNNWRTTHVVADTPKHMQMPRENLRHLETLVFLPSADYPTLVSLKADTPASADNTILTEMRKKTDQAKSTHTERIASLNAIGTELASKTAAIDIETDPTKWAQLDVERKALETRYVAASATANKTRVEWDKCNSSLREIEHDIRGRTSDHSRTGNLKTLEIPVSWLENAVGDTKDETMRTTKMAEFCARLPLALDAVRVSVPVECSAEQFKLTLIFFAAYNTAGMECRSRSFVAQNQHPEIDTKAPLITLPATIVKEVQCAISQFDKDSKVREKSYTLYMDAFDLTKSDTLKTALTLDGIITRPRRVFTNVQIEHAPVRTFLVRGIADTSFDYVYAAKMRARVQSYLMDALGCVGPVGWTIVDVYESGTVAVTAAADARPVPTIPRTLMTHAVDVAVNTAEFAPSDRTTSVQLEELMRDIDAAE